MNPHASRHLAPRRRRLCPPAPTPSQRPIADTTPKGVHRSKTGAGKRGGRCLEVEKHTYTVPTPPPRTDPRSPNHRNPRLILLQIHLIQPQPTVPPSSSRERTDPIASFTTIPTNARPDFPCSILVARYGSKWSVWHSETMTHGRDRRDLEVPHLEGTGPFAGDAFD